MGLKIYKALGYGITNFQVPEDWEEVVMERAYHTNLKELITFCSEQKGRILTFSKSDPRFAAGLLSTLHLEGKDYLTPIGNLITHDSEFGIPGVILFTPINSSDWKRADDTLDYYDEAQRGSNDPRLVEIKGGIHPYSAGQPPPDIYGLLLWLGLEHLAPELKEYLYVWWG
jgi:hypothetical protein